MQGIWELAWKFSKKFFLSFPNKLVNSKVADSLRSAFVFSQMSKLMPHIYLLLFKKVILYSQDDSSRRRVKKSCFVLNAAIIQLLATGPLGIITWSPLLFSLPRHLFRWLNHLFSFSTYLDYIFLRVRPGTVARILCLLKPYKFFTIMISATMPFSEWKSASEIYHN